MTGGVPEIPSRQGKYRALQWSNVAPSSEVTFTSVFLGLLIPQSVEACFVSRGDFNVSFNELGKTSFFQLSHGVGR